MTLSTNVEIGYPGDPSGPNCRYASNAGEIGSIPQVIALGLLNVSMRG